MVSPMSTGETPMTGQTETWDDIIARAAIPHEAAPPRPSRVCWQSVALGVAILCLGLVLTIEAIELTGADPLGSMTDYLVVG
jgi:hypothetical protein